KKSRKKPADSAFRHRAGHRRPAAPRIHVRDAVGLCFGPRHSASRCSSGQRQPGAPANNDRHSRPADAIDIAMQQRLHALTAPCKQARHQKEPHATADERAQHERKQGHRQCAGRNGEDLVGYRREPCNENGPEPIVGEPLRCRAVGRPVRAFLQPGHHGIDGEVTDQIAEEAAHHRRQRCQKREPPCTTRVRQTHGCQHDVGWNRKKDRFKETQYGEIPGRLRMTRPLHGPGIERRKDLHVVGPAWETPRRRRRALAPSCYNAPCIGGPRQVAAQEKEVSVHAETRRISVPELTAYKGQKKIAALTAYIAPIARLIDEHLDMILVGDSTAMVGYGMADTLSITPERMTAHARAVVQATLRACVVVDMPFGSYQESPELAFRNAAAMMAGSGVQAVKIEGTATLAPTTRFMVERGVPVLAHVGLMPQYMNVMGGFKAQGFN